MAGSVPVYRTSTRSRRKKCGLSRKVGASGSPIGMTSSETTECRPNGADSRPFPVRLPHRPGDFQPKHQLCGRPEMRRGNPGVGECPDIPVRLRPPEAGVRLHPLSVGGGESGVVVSIDRESSRLRERPAADAQPYTARAQEGLRRFGHALGHEPLIAHSIGEVCPIPCFPGGRCLRRRGLPSRGACRPDCCHHCSRAGHHTDCGRDR